MCLFELKFEYQRGFYFSLVLVKRLYGYNNLIFVKCIGRNKVKFVSEI
ncbi:hypothetical protein Bcop_1674 [Bacteroides coprosuis DSM 18011]|uniref:Uncharacterized protein n=1 Tax=Bacteroides coprosuis DSM 18011 TaxID=679937 RepID=F3ZQZ3_9BACE|nr:hypothetical protein Bcop_1674 [Bacteroides coprosuis DSM 18011]